MNNIGSNAFDIGYMDTLASGASAIHRLDARAKVIVTLVFIAAVISCDKYAISQLIPFFIFPISLITIARLPVRFFLKKILFVLPFAALIGLFNPLIDQKTIFHVGNFAVSGGWVSFLSILLRFTLTVMSALILVSITGFNAVCESLEKFGVPKPFVIQLLFLYRYIFVLIEEVERIVRAYSFRAVDAGMMNVRTFSSVVGHLLLRTFDRAERIYQAMRCRGFDGSIHVISAAKIRMQEISFICGWMFLFCLFRFVDIPLKIGMIATGIMR